MLFLPRILQSFDLIDIFSDPFRVFLRTRRESSGRAYGRAFFFQPPFQNPPFSQTLFLLFFHSSAFPRVSRSQIVSG